MPRTRSDSTRSRAARLAVSLEDHALVVAALRQTRTEELGDMGYAEALRVLSESLDAEAELGLTGRRAAKTTVVELLARRAAIATTTSAPIEDRRSPIIVCGLPGSGASRLRRELRSDPRVASIDEPFNEIDLRSMSFESRWHVPAYAEWLQGADPTSHLQWVDRALHASGDARPGVIGGWVDVEHLDAVRSVWPGATVVVVSTDQRSAADVAIARCVAERQTSGSRTEVDVIERYWRWRVTAMSERLDATLDVATLVVAPHAETGDLVERIISSA